MGDDGVDGKGECVDGFPGEDGGFVGPPVTGLLEGASCLLLDAVPAVDADGAADAQDSVSAGRDD